MTSNDNYDFVNDNHKSVENEQEPNLKNPDRRRVLGATAAAAAALGTVGQAASPALAQPFKRKPGGTTVDASAVITAMKNARTTAAGAAGIDITKYLHPIRIVPMKTDDGCACGCS
jgi:hypothetical protein